jgi:Cu/Ag efflux pump CusA
VYAVLVIAAAVLPLLFLRGEGGTFLPPIALAYLLAVAASMVCTVLVLPVLCVLLLTREPADRGDRLAHRWLRGLYEKTGSLLLGRPRAAIAVLAVTAVAVLLVAPFVGSTQRPDLRERDVVVAVTAPPGTSLPRMTAVAAELVAELEALRGVDEANAHVGRAVMSDQSVDVNAAQIWVSMDPDADHDRTLAAIKAAAAVHEDLSTAVTTYSARRVTEVLGEDQSDITVRVYGENQDVLDAKVAEIGAGVAGLEGVSDVRTVSAPEEQTIEVHVDLAKAQGLGIKPGDVRRAAASLLGGITVGNLFEEQKVFDVVVWGAPQVREDEEDIRNLLIDAPDGGQVRLGDVAEVVTVPDKAVIRHESVSRYTELTADVSGRDVGEVAADVEALIDRTEFPLDHHAELFDGYAQRRADLDLLGTVALTVLVAVLLLLQAAFRSWRLAVVGLVALVAAMSGGLLAALAVDGRITLGSAAGLVAGLGVATRGLVSLLGHYRRLRLWGDEALDVAVVTRATGAMVVPTVLSALATVVLFAPAAVMGRQPGLEVLAPAAVVILGVALTATLVNLLVVPAMYLRFGKAREDDIWADETVLPRPGAEDVPAPTAIPTGGPS